MNDTPRSADWQEGFNYAMSVMAHWLNFQHFVEAEKKNGSEYYVGASLPSRREVGMSKSALLGRLMRGEEIRNRACPVHKGKMWCFFGFMEDYSNCGCGGTGWLPNEKEEARPAP